MATIAIAILNYNGEEHLNRFLPSVIEHSSDYDIIVGDNGSSDGSIALLKTSFPSVKVVELHSNYGYAGGYNKLLEQLSYDYILLINSDVEVTENWLNPLIAALDNDPNIAAVQPKILSYTNKKEFEYAGAAGGFIDIYGYPYCRGRVFDTLEEDNGQYDTACTIFWASGACFLVRLEVFKNLGGFDDSYFAHMEEIDLNWRMINSGYEIKFIPESVVYHLGGGTLSYNSSRKTYLNFRNSWTTLLKNSSQKIRSRVIFVRTILDFISMGFYLLKLQPSNSYAVLRALIYTLRNGHKIQQTVAVNDDLSRNNSKLKPSEFSLVWQYFVRGKRKFTEL